MLHNSGMIPVFSTTLVQSLTISDFGDCHRLILLSEIRHHTVEPNFLQHLRRKGQRSEHFRH